MVVETQQVISFAGQQDSAVVHLAAIQRMHLQLLGASEMSAYICKKHKIFFFLFNFFSVRHFNISQVSYTYRSTDEFLFLVSAQLGAHQSGQVLDPHKVPYSAMLMIWCVEQVNVSIPLLAGETQWEDCGTFFRLLHLHLEAVHVDGDVVQPFKHPNLSQRHQELNTLNI